MSRTAAILRDLVLCSALLAGPLHSTWAAGDTDAISIYVAEQLTHDDNIYRIPASVDDLGAIIAPGATRQDYINRVSLGLHGQWQLGRQILGIDLRVDDNRYRDNDHLDNTSGNARVLWTWTLTSKASGQLGADFDRSLVSFANNRVLLRDLLDRSGYFGDVRYALSPRWRLTAGLRYTESSHSADVRRFDDFEGKMVQMGIEYERPKGTLLGAGLRYMDARFPLDAAGAPSSYRYDEDSAYLRVRHPLTAKTSFEGNLGRLKRHYPTTPRNDFSGNTWRASLQWEATAKTRLALAAWRDITAFVDAESDYFVSRGVSVGPAWAPTSRLRFALKFSWEKLDYLDTTLDPLSGASRRDTLDYQTLVATYDPRSWLELSLSARREQRESNRPLFDYRDTLISAGIRLKF